MAQMKGDEAEEPEEPEGQVPVFTADHPAAGGDHLQIFGKLDFEFGQLGDENFGFGRLENHTRSLESRRPQPLAITDIGARSCLQGEPP